MTDPKAPIPVPGKIVPLPLDIDAAIKKQLEKVEGDPKMALVLTGEKQGSGPAKARVAFVLKDPNGFWKVKTYAEVEQHHKPTLGVEVVFTK